MIAALITSSMYIYYYFFNDDYNKYIKNLLSGFIFKFVCNTRMRVEFYLLDPQQVIKVGLSGQSTCFNRRVVSVYLVCTLAGR